MPLLITEPTSAACQRFWEDADTVVSCRIAYFEAAAALAQAQRMGRLTTGEHTATLRKLDDLFERVDVVEVDDDLTRRAAVLASRLALRGYDAVQCASAEQIADPDLVAAAGDTQLLGAWHTLGISTFDPNATLLDRTPLSMLVLRTPRLELRLPTDEELHALARRAEEGVHDPQQMPFYVPWTDPSPTFIQDFVAHHRETRKRWQPDDWRLELAVFLAGRPIGIQAIGAENFAEHRTIGSGSWLGIGLHGRGYGTEMRTAMLELAFSGLGAEAAVSGAFVDNPASARVSEKLGYVEDGVRWPLVRGKPVQENRFRLTRDRFEATDHMTVTIEGLDDCRALFGATGSGI